MAVVQISRIQHRRGTSGELPDALADGELGMTTDTGEIFFGASDHPSVSGRKSYPYQNIKILTELDVQYGIKGDVYYHGPLAGEMCQGDGIARSVIPLFAHGTRDFAVYDFALSTTNRSSKAVGTISVCVHPGNPDSSIVTVEMKSVMPAGAFSGVNQAMGSDPTGWRFKLTRFDNQGNDTGTTWLSFRNDLEDQNNNGVDLILSISGREWSNPSV